MRNQPRAYSGDFRIIIRAESAYVNFFQVLMSEFLLRFSLPERSEHCVHVVVQIALLQSLPLVPVEPDPLAAIALFQCEIKAVPHQILDHAKAALGTIDMPAWLSQRQAAIAIVSLRQIGA